MQHGHPLHLVFHLSFAVFTIQATNADVQSGDLLLWPYLDV